MPKNRGRIEAPPRPNEIPISRFRRSWLVEVVEKSNVKKSKVLEEYAMDDTSMRMTGARR